MSSLLDFLSALVRGAGDGGERIVPSVLALILFVPMATAWVWAACRAAAQGEERGQSPEPHFLLGLALPFVYPWLMGRATPRPTPVPEPPRPPALTMTPPPPLDAAPVMSDEPMPDNGVFDGAYFVKLARTGRVRPEAPCVISYGGAGVCVRRILEVQPSVLIVEMVSEDPDAPKVSATGTRVRIPLEKIEKVILSQDVANDKDEP